MHFIGNLTTASGHQTTSLPTQTIARHEKIFLIFYVIGELRKGERRISAIFQGGLEYTSLKIRARNFAGWFNGCAYGEHSEPPTCRPWRLELPTWTRSHVPAILWQAKHKWRHRVCGIAHRATTAATCTSSPSMSCKPSARREDRKVYYVGELNCRNASDTQHTIRPKRSPSAAQTGSDILTHLSPAVTGRLPTPKHP